MRMILLPCLILLACGACHTAIPTQPLEVEMQSVDGQGEPPGAPGEMIAIPTRVEMVSDEIGTPTIHGWHTGRLLKHNGALYATAMTPGTIWTEQSLVFRRDGDNRWTRLARFEPRVYTWEVDPEGYFYASAASSFEDATVFRTHDPLDFDNFDPVYETGTCAYLSAGASPEGNFLLLHAESVYDVPNAIIAMFYDKATGKWYRSRFVTPEGRYGYEGFILRGRKVIGVINSSAAEPMGKPTPGASWRHIRLIRCDDLTKGDWTVKAWHIPPFGDTALQDLIEGPDGALYLSYSFRSGETWEETMAQPIRHCIARIDDDLSAETFPTGISVGASRLFVDSRGSWYLVGRPIPPVESPQAAGQTSRPGLELHVWRLDPSNGFKPMAEFRLPGTEMLQGYVNYTLRPGQHGGEADGDTVHLLSARQDDNATPDPTKPAELWYATFSLDDVPAP